MKLEDVLTPQELAEYQEWRNTIFANQEVIDLEIIEENPVMEDDYDPTAVDGGRDRDVYPMDRDD